MSENACIEIENARTHNLKNISVRIPKNRIVAVTGVSGSGKSSLIFDTVYTEAQRQLIETFSTFARRRLPKLSRPDVDEIRNLSTAIIIDQKPLGRNMRSTVGTATEVFTYLRMLYSRIGKPFIGASYKFSFNHPEGMCPECRGLGKRIRVREELLIDPERSLRDGAVTHPDFKIGGWYWKEIMNCGLFDTEKKLKDFTGEERSRLLYERDVEIDAHHASFIYTKKFEGIVAKLERLYVNKGEEELPEGKKDAYTNYLEYSDCPSCGGSRLNAEARSVIVNGLSIERCGEMELTELDAFLAETAGQPGSEGEIALPLVRKMRGILGYLIGIGVGYLSLSRGVATLSGGEAQRLKMARQMDCDLTGLLYILDEPSIGLHPRDTGSLITMLRGLMEKGNSVLVVEHDPQVIEAADYVIDVGPEAGKLGGRIEFTGTVAELKESNCLTGKLLKEPLRGISRRRPWKDSYLIENASLHNLKGISVRIPKGIFTCVTGVAGSGKSSLINDIFVAQEPEAVVIDQGAIGRSSRSTPATYTGIFDLIRKEFASHTNSDPSLFSFNSSGACPACKGQGSVRIEMNFMDDVQILCDSCEGKRYTEEVLSLTYRGKNIFEALSMTVEEAEGFFATPAIKKQLKVLREVGLGYLEIGQPVSSLSGGEAQRLKLAGELKNSGNLYIMDEPTTGLHMADIERLMRIIHTLADRGNTVVVIEHNLDVIAQADWIIDLGPDGGRAGGYLVAEGRPEDIAACEGSRTGTYLRGIIAQRSEEDRHESKN